MDAHSTGNRILDAITFYLEEQTTYRINNPHGSKKDGYGDILYREFLKNVLNAYTKGLSVEERKTRNILRNEIRKLNAKINASFINLLLNGSITRWVLNQFFRNYGNVIAHKIIFENTINKVSAENNVRNLDEQIKAKGFHQNIEHALQKSVSQGLPAFHLRYADVRHPNTDFVLHFRKIPSTGAYEFHKYDAAARPAWDKPTKIEDNKWLSFQVNILNPIKASEAAHLVNRRTVYRDDGQWITINPANMRQISVYFDLEKALKELPLVKLNPRQFKNIVSGLKQGECRDVMIEINGKFEIFTLQASPLEQKIRVTDSSGKTVDLKYLQQQKNNVSKRVGQILQHAVAPVIKANFQKRIR